MFLQGGARGHSTNMYYTGEVFQRMCTYYDMLINMIWFKNTFIRTYERMGVRTDERATDTIIFNQGVIKDVRVNYYEL